MYLSTNNFKNISELVDRNVYNIKPYYRAPILAASFSDLTAVWSVHRRVWVLQPLGSSELATGRKQQNCVDESVKETTRRGDRNH